MIVYMEDKMTKGLIAAMIGLAVAALINKLMEK